MSLSGAGYFVAILLAGFATYLTRFPSLLLGRSLTVPPRIERGLRYIPIGVFAALIAPAIFLHPAVHGHLDYAFWCAVAAALAIASWTKSPLWTMLAGVITVAVLRAL